MRAHHLALARTLIVAAVPFAACRPAAPSEVSPSASAPPLGFSATEGYEVILGAGGAGFIVGQSTPRRVVQVTATVTRELPPLPAPGAPALDYPQNMAFGLDGVVWAQGYCANETERCVARLDGDAWTSVPYATGDVRLRQLFVSPEGTPFVVISNDDTTAPDYNRLQLLRWDGARWERFNVDVPETDQVGYLPSAHAESRSVVWLEISLAPAGRLALVRVDESSARVVPTPSEGDLGDDPRFAVLGGVFHLLARSGAYRYEHDAWTPVTAPVRPTLMHGTGPNDVWIAYNRATGGTGCSHAEYGPFRIPSCGADSAPAVAHFDGASWTYYSTPMLYWFAAVGSGQARIVTMEGWFTAP